MSYSASFQLKGLPNCQMLKFEVRKSVVTLVPIESYLLSKISLKPKMSDFFQNSSFAALWPARTHSASFERSTFFLQYNTLKKYVSALLR